ncbi:MAG: ParA family protein, partial [Gammaproteobacteria bacterium]|nr:ParA family protein [Gammaproteobacteria bacterium]
MQKIIVLNTKGGCGKSTIATNLAAYYAAQGFQTSLMDYDPQGSSMRWLSKRDESRALVNGIAATDRSASVTRSWQLRVPTQTER